jgi:catechol 2,3-dioxygenase-like lactoylglutathione lyase family enzyme
MGEPGRLIVVVLHASDLARSVQFYRDLVGLPLESGFNDPEADPWYGGYHAEISWREGAYLHFALFPSRPPHHRVTSGAELGLLLEDLRQVHARLVGAGVEALHDPRPEPWGATARYLDPDGNIVGITAR